MLSLMHYYGFTKFLLRHCQCFNSLYYFIFLSGLVSFPFCNYSCLSVVNQILDDIKRVIRSLQQVRFVADNMQDSAGPNQDSKPSYISQEKLIYIG
jgi:hypothetical protein